MKNHTISNLIAINLVAILILQMGGTAQAQVPVPSMDPALQVVETTSQGLVLELVVPEFQLEQGTSDLGSCQALHLPGWGLSGEPGEPALPIKGTLVGIPPGSNPRVTVLDTGPVITQSGIDLCPASTLIQSNSLAEDYGDMVEQVLVNPAAYDVNRDYPGPIAQVGDLSMIRSQQVMQVLISPFLYNPVTHQLKTYSHLTVQVDFGTPDSLQFPSTMVDEGTFESILRSQVINYEAARVWRIRPVAQMTAKSAPSSPACKISVSQDGMVSISSEELQSACPQVASLDPRNFQLYSQDSQVAILVPGESDGTFGSGDSIIFYGQMINSRFTDINVYWLTAGEETGVRMDSSDGEPGEGSTPATFVATVHREEDHAYLSAYPSSLDQSHWYWALINSTAPRTYNITLPKVNIEAEQAHLLGFFKGYAASPQHHTHISINGHLISEAFWPARSEFSFDIVIPQIYLNEGANTIQVECPLTDGISVNQVLVDWFKIDYVKDYSYDGTQTLFSGDSAGVWKYRLTGLSSNDFLTWDITDPQHPVMIDHTVFEPSDATFDLLFQQTITSKRLYLTTSPGNLLAPLSISLAKEPELQQTSNSADYIIITHPLFIDAIQPLVTYYTGRGLRVKVVDVLDIYDEFNGGVFNPAAIHDFLAYTYTNWVRPAPSYVLLVGDGNYDFKNFFLRNDPEYIPPFLVDVDPWMGETAADNRYVTISGGDILPDMAVGRLPVKTVSEASAVVTKILNRYQHISADWTNNALFVAGINDPSAGDFPALSDSVISSYLPQTVLVDKVYFGSSPITSGIIARQVITDAINAGRGLVHFIGHSNPSAWFGDPNAADPLSTTMLDLSTAQALVNSEKYPIFISMTCYTGYFIVPGGNTLDETLIKGEGKGAVATWSPTGKGVASGHDLLDSGFFTAVYQDYVSTLGNATTQAKYYLSANSQGLHRELIDTYILFGDPAMLYQSNPTGVDLNYFRAEKTMEGVQLSWETVSETTLGGFNLYRREMSGEFVKVNVDLIPPQNGGQPEGSIYTYLDTGALPGTMYEYRLDVIENSLQVLQSRIVIYWPYMIMLPHIQN